VEVELHRGELTVRDHGPGIAPQDVSHIFDRFYRGVEARGRPGSGLGLAIVRQVVDQHGGKVSAERPPGGGTLMRVTLPVAEPLEEPEPGALAPASAAPDATSAPDASPAPDARTATGARTAPGERTATDFDVGLHV